MPELDFIEKLLLEGKTDDAISRLDAYLSVRPTDRAFYLRGNAYRKKGDWQGAMNNYLQAVKLNPDSPAANALEMANEILDFYNKDMYNH
ncbi:MAG: tetratricopeptide repeat protein [Candidatus Cryptobacteroides sp.]|jgi:predicted negative regulator of RcsB-dependent stress response